MRRVSQWERYYSLTPLEKIPWQHTQADYFIKVLNSGKIKPGKALDLGCGTGKKSIELARRGFEVTGVDISLTAIKYAKENAKQKGVKAKFIVGDVTNLSLLGKEEFDFVLDWATFHGIPKSKQKKYIRDKMELGFLTPMGLVYMFSQQDIERLYGNFKILETYKSRPYAHPGKWFDEYLMEKVK